MSNALTRMRIALRERNVDEDRSRSLLFWARSFLDFCNIDDPERLTRDDVEAFLVHASGERFVGRPARGRAVEAIEWLFRANGDGVPAWMKLLIEERRPDSTPNILSREEVGRLLAQMTGETWLAAALVYGTGIRLLECVRLRVRDIDLEQNRLIVRDSADRVGRRLPLPENTETRLMEHLEKLRLSHIRDIVDGNARTTLPPPIAARSPEVARSWGWQYLFPDHMEHRRSDPGGIGPTRTIHHVDPQMLHRKFERVALEASIYRRVTGHVLRNSFALHMVQQGVPVSRVERMLGTRAAEPGDDAEALSLSIPSQAAPSRGSFH